ncbi:MAG: ABC transporter permease, partial [Eubacteriales bacterium]|nr:ABC transporter permease [Eubacteriales bacterium]
MTAFLAAAVIAGTPLLFATLGELITEKAGNLNLGVEGMMLMGAVMGFGVGLWTGNPFLAIIGAIGAGAAGAAIYAVLTVSLRANQVVTGLTLTIFGTGFASFVGKSFMGVPAPASVKSAFVTLEIPLLSKIPVFGPMLFQQDIFIYFGYLITIGASLYL